MNFSTHETNKEIEFLLSKGYPKEIVDSDGNLAKLSGIQPLLEGYYDAIYKFPGGERIVFRSEAIRMSKPHKEAIYKLPNEPEFPKTGEKVSTVVLSFAMDGSDFVCYTLLDADGKEVSDGYISSDPDWTNYWTVEKAMDDVMIDAFEEKGICYRLIGNSIDKYLINSDHEKENSYDRETD